MRQVLLDLLSNAVKFNRQGGSARISARVTDAGHLSVAVTDTGIGVDPAVIPELFEPFRQANSSITRQYGGSGLGPAGRVLTPRTPAGRWRGPSARVKIRARRAEEVGP